MQRYVIFLVAAHALGQDLEYWPLTPGNQWVYTASLGEPLTVEVTRNETIGENTYALVRGLAGVTETPLRQCRSSHPLFRPENHGRSGPEGPERG